MKRIFAVAISLALLVATPGLAAADVDPPTSDQFRDRAGAFTAWRAIRVWRWQRCRPQPGHRFGGHSGRRCRRRPSVADPLAGNAGATGLNLSPVASPVAEPRVSRVGFDSSGLVLYAFAGVGIKLPRSSGEQYKVGQKVLPSQALPGDLIFYGPEGSQSVALFVGNGQMVEATDPAVTVSPVRTSGMTPYLTRIIG